MDPAVIFTAINVLLAVFVGWRTIKLNERKAKIEYWQGVAENLTKRFDVLDARCMRLEETLARYRMMKDYVFEAIADNRPVIVTAQKILDGTLDHNRRGGDSASE